MQHCVCEYCNSSMQGCCILSLALRRLIKMRIASAAALLLCFPNQLEIIVRLSSTMCCKRLKMKTDTSCVSGARSGGSSSVRAGALRARTCTCKVPEVACGLGCPGFKCEPSQNGGLLVCLQTHRNLAASAGTLNLSDFMPLPLWLPSQNGCKGYYDGIGI